VVTATAGRTKDGRENFVLCNVELGIVYILRERKICVERKRSKNRGKKKK